MHQVAVKRGHHGIRPIQIHTEGEAAYADDDEHFRTNNLFIGPNMRKAVNEGRADYTPIFLSQIPRMIEADPPDVVLIQVSPPDEHGFCSLGPSVECTLAAIRHGRHIVAQMNSRMPRTNGESFVHISQIDCVVKEDRPLPAHEAAPPNDVQSRIGQLIAENLVKDGSTLQMGIGAIPDAVLASLGQHKDLGVHTEMFSDQLIPLIKAGVITNRHKQFYPGVSVTTFAFGSQQLYDFIDNNPSVAFLDVKETNNIQVIASNPNVVAINSCIECDLTGQVAADSIGSRLYSGVGGQLDFILGASLSSGGVPIIAMPATTSSGESRITASLRKGGAVVTTRAHTHYVVTEYGIAYLFGKSLQERAAALIEIAHPKFQEELEEAAYNMFRNMRKPIRPASMKIRGVSDSESDSEGDDASKMRKQEGE